MIATTRDWQPDKIVASEKGTLADDSRYVAEIGSLEPQLDEAFNRSRLPEEVSLETRRAIEDFLLRCRKALGPL